MLIFLPSRVENCWHGLGIEPTTSDLGSHISQVPVTSQPRQPLIRWPHIAQDILDWMFEIFISVD